MIDKLQSKIYNSFKIEHNVKENDERKEKDKEKEKREKSSDRVNKYDKYENLGNFSIDDLDLDNFHGFNVIRDRNNGNENIPDIRIGNKKGNIHNDQRRSNVHGQIVEYGSNDYRKEYLSEMKNVNRRENL